MASLGHLADALDQLRMVEPGPGLADAHSPKQIHLDPAVYLLPGLGIFQPSAPASGVDPVIHRTFHFRIGHDKFKVD